jgi:predicted RND superfamily exporter protein
MPIMKSIAEFVVRNRIMIIIIVVILTILSAYQMIKIKMNADFATYLQQDDPLVQQYNKIGDKFGGKSTAMVLIETDDIFNAQNLKLIGDLTNAYQSLKEVSYVTSLTNVMDFKKVEGELEVGKLISQADINDELADLADLKNYVMSKEMYTGNIVSYDATTTLIALRLTPGENEYSAAQKIKEATEEIAPTMENIYFGGMPFLIFSMTEGILESIHILVPLMIFLLVLVLYLGFRTLSGILLPLLVVLISTIWIIGLMVVFGFSMDMLSGIMPVILLAMGSADCIHILKRYYEERNSGETPHASIKKALIEMGKPMILTTITTIVGFLSLVISNFSVISQFGVVTAVGLFLALTVSFTFLPAVISLSTSKSLNKARRVPGKVTGYLEKSAELIHNNKKPVLIFSLSTILLAAFAIPRIVTDVDWTLCLKRGSKPWQAEMLMREKFKGSLPVQISIEGDIRKPSTLKSMRYLERYLESLPLVSKSRSLATVLSEMNEVVNDRFVIPETEQGVANLCFLIEGEKLIEQLVHHDYQEALIQARFGTMQTQKMAMMSDSTDRFLKNLPDHFVVIDRRTIPPQILGQVIDKLIIRITDNIINDLEKRNIETERLKIENVVRNSFYSALTDDITKHNIYEKLIAYILSEEAEMEITSNVAAGKIAESVVAAMKDKGKISAEQIKNLMFTMSNDYSDEDISLISESLERLVTEEINEAKIQHTLDQILNLIPSLSPEIKHLVIRDIKGDLWAINENQITMSKNDYQKIFGEFKVPAVDEYKAKFTHTGLVPILKKMEEELTPTQIGSVLVALIFITIILSIIFRSPLVGFISVVPIILTVMVNFAVIGYLNIGLDSFIAMIASITIGLGVDYSIHFTSRFRRELFRLKDSMMALKKTFSTTGVAIIINSLAVGLGFMVLMLGPCQHVRMFGRLTTLTMITSTIFTLAVLPALTLWLKPKYINQANGDKYN